MKKIIATLMLGVILGVQPVHAAEPEEQKEESTISPAPATDAPKEEATISAAPVTDIQKKKSISLWDSLRKKIETFTPKKKLVATTAVGGVRGALVESDDLYWKGEAVVKEIDAMEFNAFNDALSLFESGNTEGAINAFNKFVKEYPESTLVADANNALELLQEE
ncbi:MAG: hypothetical protein GQ470_01950 [Gammaproteobacteria bacterium]|nr:hypothetical protein [Gammaproteobacteria bacterium]